MGTLNKILELANEQGFEIVSYGLAPNPNGFCFESHGEATPEQERSFNRILEGLMPEEVSELRAWLTA